MKQLKRPLRQFDVLCSISQEILDQYNGIFLAAPVCIIIGLDGMVKESAGKIKIKGLLVRLAYL